MDDDKDGLLTIENFLTFYLDACQNRPGVVWKNLHANHYRNDLKKLSEVREDEINVELLPRYILT